jgi:hypothetical protein
MFNRILNRIVSFDKKKGGGRFNYGVKMRSQDIKAPSPKKNVTKKAL